MKINRTKKTAIGGVSLLIFGIVFGWLIFPLIMRYIVHQRMNLKEGSQVRPMWRKFPFAIDFRMYLFNVTNPDEIKTGAKPILREVGPYYFEEWQEKVDLRDREEDDTVDYNIKNKWFFKSERSGSLTGEEEVIVPHIFILAMMMKTVRDKISMVPIVSKAVDSIFENPDNVFIKAKAMDIMFNGLPVNCTVDDFAGTAICALLRDNADDLVQDDVDMYRFSFLGAKNDTSTKKRIRVLRGVENQMDIGKVVEYDGKKTMSTWGDEYCDTFNGTDGTVFHPFFGEKEDIVAFTSDICRSLSITFEKKSSFKGFSTSRYTAFLGDPNTIPWQKCYCPAPKKCLGRGVMDIYKCSGVPIVLSHPHFYDGDESYLQMVDGLSPSKEKHEIWMEFDPLFGVPLAATRRIQVNIMIHKVEKFKLMKEFPEALLPLFWMEEAIELPDWILAGTQYNHTMMTVANYFTWIIILCGLGICCYALFLHFKLEKVDITKVNKNTKS